MNFFFFIAPRSTRIDFLNPMKSIISKCSSFSSSSSKLNIFGHHLSKNIVLRFRLLLLRIILTLPSSMSFSMACVTVLSSLVKKMYSAISSGDASTLNDCTGGGAWESWKRFAQNDVYRHGLPEMQRGYSIYAPIIH